MKKPTVIIIVCFLLFNFLILSPEPLSFTKQISALRYGKDTRLSTVDASFIGEYDYDKSGYCVNGAGDVNGDGYDDFIISAPLNDTAGLNSGKIYLIFGKASGWSMDFNLSNADASFHGECPGDMAGGGSIVQEPRELINGAGDVNGDGYDDILIGATYNQEGGADSGQVYLIFGNESGWSTNTNLSNSSASFIGEGQDNWLGNSVAGVGDVNGDGYDDMMLGAPGNSEAGLHAGKAYLIFGKDDGWTNDTNISIADVSFIGENADDCAAWSVAGAGDVNGDGYDDILINSLLYMYGGISTGQTYLIFGKAAGWLKKNDLDNSDASFIAESGDVNVGTPCKGVGDVNGDGYDDIMMGGVDFNKAYLIFGKANGWSMYTSLSNADASFIGEVNWDYAGSAIDGVGDINFDGYDDILIGAYLNDESAYPNAGQAYLIYGKPSGWTKDFKLSNADASFWGEGATYWAGWSVANAGDVNGDGVNDILIGELHNHEGGDHAGQTYLIFLNFNFAPKVISSVKAYLDADCKNETTMAEIGYTVYVELLGVDQNTTHIDYTAVSLTTSSNSSNSINFYLKETGVSTGRFRGSFKISNRTHSGKRVIAAVLRDNITITSLTDPTKNITIYVDELVQLRPFQDKLFVMEDSDYFMHYWAYGYNTVSAWTLDTNASWLALDDINHDLYGTPDNGDVGTFWVWLNITDGLGNYDRHNFNITVKNTPPNITNADDCIALEDEVYYVDYTSSDDGQGVITWHLETNASWLEIELATGELSGTPTNDERGTYWINVSVDDGNEGIDWSNFEVTVLDTNDAPVIITENVTEVNEDEFYSVDYNATDIDGPTTFKWYLDTNASWLNINNDSGELYGTPTNDDVGISYVNVTVSDLRDGEDSQNFTLKVRNINDPPEWITVPTDTAVNESDVFIFDVNAIDVDLGDVLKYSIKSQPATNISIDRDTGLIVWNVSIENLTGPKYTLEVKLYVSDGKLVIYNSFKITVIYNPRPTTQLLSPKDGSLGSAIGTELSWEGHDDENDTLTFDVYFGKDFTSVFELLKTVRILHNTNVTSYIAEGLDVGSTYYWTVIPHDGVNYGVCLDEIFSFEINSPPIISTITSQKATVDQEFRFDIEASDLNPGDVQKFEYSLGSAPEGMTIEPTNGLITWKPTKDQIGLHNISVWVSDGIDNTNITFEIEVTDKEVEDESTGIILFSIFALVIVIILLFIIFFMWLKKKKKVGEDKEKPKKPSIEKEKIELGTKASEDDDTIQEKSSQTPPSIDSQLPQEPKQKFCPTCGLSLKYLQKKDKYYCKQCKKFD